MLLALVERSRWGGGDNSAVEPELSHRGNARSDSGAGGRAGHGNEAAEGHDVLFRCSV